MDMCSVRGMGVAVSVSTSTDCFIFLMASLWATPKRCSSSTTSRPRFLNSTSLASSRWVPTITSTSPSRSLRRMSFCSAAVLKRLMVSTWMGKPLKRLSMVA